MVDYKEHTNESFETIFFIILFSLFAVILFSKSENQTSSLSRYSQFELSYGNISINKDATIFNAVCLPDLYRNSQSAPHNTSLNLFSLQYNISNYNHRSDQYFLNIQKTRLLIEPLFLWRIYYLLPLSGKTDPPVLS